MTNNFQEIEPQEDVPLNLKGEVGDTIHLFHFFSNIVDLFIVKFAQSASVFITEKNENPEDFK